MSWISICAEAGIGIVYAALAMIEKYVKKPDEWHFSTDHVTRNSFPKKTYEWVAIDNVIIRDNLFTLDFRNNVIIQKELDVPVDTATQEEFNAFCKNKLLFTGV